MDTNILTCKIRFQIDGQTAQQFEK